MEMSFIIMRHFKHKPQASKITHALPLLLAFHVILCIKNFGASATSCRTKIMSMFMGDTRKSLEKSATHYGSLLDRPLASQICFEKR